MNDGLSLEDAVELRTLLDFPGGLELHIGMLHTWWHAPG
jgi:hypothetical protein